MAKYQRISIGLLIAAAAKKTSKQRVASSNLAGRAIFTRHPETFVHLSFLFRETARGFHTAEL
jgi:hypothetical protein